MYVLNLVVATDTNYYIIKTQSFYVSFLFPSLLASNAIFSVMRR